LAFRSSSPRTGRGGSRRAGFSWSHRNEQDPGIVLVELLAYIADALSDYADRVAAEARRRTRRRAVAGAASLVALAWCCRRRR
jgi:hypothetical protein